LKPQEFFFEVRNAVKGGGQFPGSVLQFALEYRQPVGGFAMLLDLFAERVNFTCPASLVMFFAVLGECCALQRMLELLAQIVGTCGGVG